MPGAVQVPWNRVKSRSGKLQFSYKYSIWHGQPFMWSTLGMQLPISTDLILLCTWILGQGFQCLKEIEITRIIRNHSTAWSIFERVRMRAFFVFKSPIFYANKTELSSNVNRQKIRFCIENETVSNNEIDDTKKSVTTQKRYDHTSEFEMHRMYESTQKMTIQGDAIAIN